MRTYDVERSYLADGVPDTSLLQEMRQDALDAHPKIGMCCSCGGSFSKRDTVVIDTNVGPCEMCHACADNYEGVGD